MRLPASLLVALSLVAPAAAPAQERSAQPGQPRQNDSGPAVDVDRLPLNLNRIRRELKHAADLEHRDGLNLRYTIQIYGTAPALQIFDEEANLVHGPVPYGAPTHRELINHVTPQEFRAPFADFSALIRWLSERNKEKGKK
jgi:hypothetical protein